jgi:4-carboxymuconolactone decarboxylase
MTDQAYDKGLEIRREMFGSELTDAHVNNTSELDEKLQELVTRYCFGEIWTREELPRNIRSMLTIAILATQGRPDQLRAHIAGARTNGVSNEEIREVLLHTMIYSGVPAGAAAFAIAREVLEGHEQKW